MRKIHRWLGVPAALFLLLASFTGVWLECVRFFGAEEAERERIRDLVSPVRAQSVGAEFGASFDRARAAAAARAGEVPSVEDYAEDSLILRLHSGEAFGDGGMVLGMVWGTLLFALNTTGSIIYFRMKPRTPGIGLRKVFWAFVAVISCALGASAHADSPFFTDDPLFSPG
jgi:uncharacterized iron-regulated membrane protein